MICRKQFLFPSSLCYTDGKTKATKKISQLHVQPLDGRSTSPLQLESDSYFECKSFIPNQCKDKTRQRPTIISDSIEAEKFLHSRRKTQNEIRNDDQTDLWTVIDPKYPPPPLSLATAICPEYCRATMIPTLPSLEKVNLAPWGIGRLGSKNIQGLVPPPQFTHMNQNQNKLTLPGLPSSIKTKQYPYSPPLGDVTLSFFPFGNSITFPLCPHDVSYACAAFPSCMHVHWIALQERVLKKVLQTFRGPLLARVRRRGKTRRGRSCGSLLTRCASQSFLYL